MRTQWTIIAVGFAALAALAGCGDNDKSTPIPSSNATEMISLLDEVDRRMAAGNACGDVRDEDFPALQRQLDQLPSDTGSSTRQTLEDGFAHLEGLVDRQCGEIEKEKEQRTTSTETEPTIPTTPTQTEPPTDTGTTETLPPTQTQTEPPTQPQTQTDTQGGGVSPGQGQGQGRGQGRGDGEGD